MPTFRLPLPPVSKNKASRLRRYSGLPGKVAALTEWEGQVRTALGGWQPPARTPLLVTVELRYPQGKLHRWGIDGRISALLDTVLGVRGDEWCDRLIVDKQLGDGWATIRVEALGGSDGD